jgi:hypothetical protein
MDCFKYQSLKGIRESDKLLLKRFQSLQIWAGRLKPSSTASEISIPARDYELLEQAEAEPMSAHSYFTLELSQNSCCLPMLNL